jgi:hypothetical protein
MKYAYALLLLLVIVGAAFMLVRSSRAAANGRQNDAAFEQRYPNLPSDVLARRSRSNAVMRAEGVPLNEWLPALDSEQDIELPSTEQVAMRAVATLVVALKGNGMPQERVDKLTRDYRLLDSLSPNEVEFLRDRTPTERERQIQTWRFESAKALLWALGFVDRLDGPRTLAGPKKLAAIVLDNTRDTFVAKARLRSKSEILDQADLIYRYRWALVDARLHQRPAPAGLNDDVAMERHQAFNWLIEHADTDWDDISLDT